MADTEELEAFDGRWPHFLIRQNAYRAIEGIVATTNHAAGQHSER